MSETKLTLTEGIEKLKALIFGAEKPAEEIVTTEQKFVDEKLADGTTIISYDAEELAQGVVVFLLDEAGQRLPLPVGDYSTENGDTFTVVDETGAIDNVVLAAEPEANPEEGQAPAPTTPAPAPMQNTPKRVIKSQVEEHVFSLEIEGVEPITVDFSSMFTAKDKEIADLKELNKQMFEVVKQLSELPASKPTETRQRFSKSSADISFKQSMAELEESMSKQNLES